MSQKFKLNSTFIWVFLVVFVSVGGFIYLFRSDAPKTLTKVKLSYFSDEAEIAQAVQNSLNEDKLNPTHFWIGVEPMKNEQIEVALKFKAELEKKAPFQKVIIDQELGWSDETAKQFGITDWIYVKENADQLGEILAKYEKEGVSYIVITASIYSTSFLAKNPIYRIKQNHPIKPTTFSFSYLASDADDERNMLFPCDTEDRAGVKEWACLVMNKSRYIRRKIDLKNPKSWVGLMDLSGERDYVVWLKKKS